MMMGLMKFYLWIVWQLYGRNNLADIIYNSTKDIFIPITVGEDQKFSRCKVYAEFWS